MKKRQLMEVIMNKELKLGLTTDYFLSLNDNQKDNYISLYQLYSNLLYQYLIDKLKLNIYDKMIMDARNHFEPVSVDNMDFYQYLAKDYLKYFYIRNNLHIERLNIEELAFLKHKYESKNNLLDQDTIKFIRKTYPKVIAERVYGDNVKVNYGPDNYPFYQESNALIIGVRFNEYYLEDGETEEEWNRKYDNREFELDNIIFCLKKELEKFEVKGSVVRYNDFSVNKLETEGKKKNE